MSVSVTRTGTTATITWATGDDPQGALADAINGGDLQAALTALRHGTYADIAAMDEYDRADALRGTARLTTALTTRVRHLAVACRESGMTWGTLASALTGDATARSTARSTYEAGIRELGTTPLRMTTYRWDASVDDDEMRGTMSGSVTAVSDSDARRDVERRLADRGWARCEITLTPVLTTH